MFTFPTLTSYVGALIRYVRFLADESLITSDRFIAVYALLVQVSRARDIDALRGLADEMQFFNLDDSVIAFNW